MKIHTGLAAMIQPFSFFREPPNVVHEFMESIVIGKKGSVPTDDIQTDPALSLFKMFGDHNGTVYADGIERGIAYTMPKGPPSDYGDFRDANIMLLHAKSKFRPFTIGLPYGVKVQPYEWEGKKIYPFTTWTSYQEPSIGYVSAIGHMINFWHFRRTEKTVEQVYLHGMTGSVATVTQTQSNSRSAEVRQLAGLPRGGVVDVLAVLDAITSGHLGGSGIDVLETEPPSPEHPLLQAWRDPAHPAHDRLILNPHSAFYSEEGLMDMRIKGSENCRRALLGQPVRNLVNGAG